MGEREQQVKGILQITDGLMIDKCFQLPLNGDLFRWTGERWELCSLQDVRNDEIYQFVGVTPSGPPKLQTLPQ